MIGQSVPESGVSAGNSFIPTRWLPFIGNTLKVAWFHVVNFLSVFILSQNDAFEAHVQSNIILVFVQGVISLVIIQPTVAGKAGFSPSWANLWLVRISLGALVFLFNSYYGLVICVIIFIDVISKLSEGWSFQTYLPGALLIPGLFFPEAIEAAFDWRWCSLIFLAGSYRSRYLLVCVRNNYKNGVSVFLQWFYTVGYLLLLFNFSRNSVVTEVREVQVYFGLTAMLVSLLEYNALKAGNPESHRARYLAPLLIGVGTLLSGFSPFLVIPFVMSSFFMLLSLSHSLKLKMRMEFWKINKAHRYAFVFQLVLTGCLFIVKDLPSGYFSGMLALLIVGPNVLFYHYLKKL